MRCLRLLLSLIAAVVVADSAAAITLVGEVREFSELVSGGVIARNDGMEPSLVTITDGAEICCGSRIVRILDTSDLLMDGGLVAGEIWSYRQASVVLRGGDVRGALWGYDDATIRVEDGEVGLGIYARYASQIDVLDGRIRGPVRSHEQAGIDIVGGSVGELAAFHRSGITMSGGTVLGGSIDAADEAIIELLGGDFEVDGQPVPFGEIPSASGLLTGRLESGAWMERDFRHAGAESRSGTIILTERTPAETVLDDDVPVPVSDAMYQDEALRVTGTTSLTLSGAGRTTGVYVEDDGGLTLNGGYSEGSIVVSDRGTAMLAKGFVGGGIYARDETAVMVDGSHILGSLHAQEDSQITVQGFDFALDGVPVAVGPLGAKTGVLTGEIGASDQFDGKFFHDGYDARHTGQISLAWNPVRTSSFETDRVINNFIFTPVSGIAVGNSLVEVVNGGVIARLAGEDTSSMVISGGEVVTNIVTNDDATATISGGTIGGAIATYGSSKLTVQGGDLNGRVYARGESTVEIVGANFEVALIPAALGPLGLKNGTLYVEYPTDPDPDEWEAAEIDVTHGGFSDLDTGTVVLKLDESVATYFSSGTTVVSNGAHLTMRSLVEGDATLQIDPGGLFLDIYVQEDAHLDMLGGRIDDDLVIGQNGSARIERGRLNGDVAVYGNGLVEVVGGRFAGGSIYVEGEDAEVLIRGDLFTVSPGGVGRIPVDYGEIEANSGELRGLLPDGEQLQVFFFRGAFGSGGRGTIRLPEPTGGALGLVALAVLGRLARRRRAA